MTGSPPRILADIRDEASSIGAEVAAAGTAGVGEISLARVRAVLGADWGFCHTAERNLGKVAELAAAEPLPSAGRDVAAQVRAIQAAIEAAPKSRSWRLRSRIGERVKWYETLRKCATKPPSARYRSRWRCSAPARAGRSRSGRSVVPGSRQHRSRPM